MKVLALNGSPRHHGNTATALQAVLHPIAEEGLQTELLHICTKPVRGCIGCGKCAERQNKQCIFDDDIVNQVLPKMIEADALIFGSPVYFAGLNGTLKCFLDRTFFVSSSNGGLFRHKVGASVAALRRSGGLPTVDAINKFIQYHEMIMPAANYWTATHGLMPGETKNDSEGMQICRVLGKNIAWIVKVLHHCKDIIPAPAREEKVTMNFIR